jgi:alpha-L-arabinofuranosidase
VLPGFEPGPKARLVLAATRPGTILLSFVSLFPERTWKGRANGLRPDLAEMLVGLSPAFVRFPGGCWVEGDTMQFAQRWKQTVGDVAARRTQYNIWQYQATNGLAYLAYLQLSEDLGAEPMFVVNCGMSHREVVPMAEMGEYVQDALDAIEYANGPADSKWGGLRAKHGRPAPFRMRLLEIGNENGGPAYQERYALFHDAIKAKYPEMQLIANVPTTSRKADIIDEHYYSNPEFFMSQADRYDAYDRKGPKIFVGEYAVTQGCGQGNLIGALGEAAFMTGMERNGDIVVLAAYAPLFVNVNHRRWNPDLINFDSSRVYGLPSYYVQKLFSEHRGDRILPLSLSIDSGAAAKKERPGAVGLGTWVTQAEYKDIRVVKGGKTLFESDPAKGTEGWKVTKGDWKADGGTIRQMALAEDHRITVGDPSWCDYTLRLKARKISGSEGFLVLFQVRDDANWLWWNIGGWGNSRHAIEHCQGGGKSPLGPSVEGKVETGQWYDIEIALEGDRVRCSLDGALVHDVRFPQPRPIYAVAGTSQAGDEVILKVVNVSPNEVETRIELAGAEGVGPKAKALVLTGKPTDENTIEEPKKVAPIASEVEGVAPAFDHTFPGSSFTVIRVKAKAKAAGR